MGVAGAQGVLGGAGDDLGRVEIGLSYFQVDHLAALRLQLMGALHDVHHQEGLDARDARRNGELLHVFAFQFCGVLKWLLTSKASGKLD